LDTQNTMTSQGNSKQKEQRWKYHRTKVQTILQSHSNKNSMVLAQKQTWRPVEQNRIPRYESTLLCPPYLTKAPKTYNGEKTAFSANVAGKVIICLQKTETRALPVTVYYYQLKSG
jgi:hypothetical protein